MMNFALKMMNFALGRTPTKLPPIDDPPVPAEVAIGESALTPALTPLNLSTTLSPPTEPGATQPGAAQPGNESPQMRAVGGSRASRRG